MGDLLLVIGTVGIIVVAASLAVEFRAWRRLDESTKSQQRAIKAADLTVHAAARGHRKRVKAAEREVFRAENPLPRRSYGRLELFDDRVRCGSQVFPLSDKTRPRVKCRGRGDKRSVTVLLEDPNWSQSLNATKVGNEHELEAEKFASDVRVFAPTAAEARARSLAALTQARRTAESVASDTSEVDTARAARAQLGDRLKASGHPPGQRWRRVATPAAVVSLLIGGIANTPPEERSSPPPPTRRSRVSPHRSRLQRLRQFPAARCSTELVGCWTAATKPGRKQRSKTFLQRTAATFGDSHPSAPLESSSVPSVDQIEVQLCGHWSEQQACRSRPPWTPLATTTETQSARHLPNGATAKQKPKAELPMQPAQSETRQGPITRA